MSNARTTGESVGKVVTQSARIELPAEGFVFEGGGVLSELEIAYETHGELTPARDNVVFVCHALTGDSHVAGYHTDPETDTGWWEEMIGPGKGIDTRYYYVVCANILGGCKGTTGPGSIDPGTGRPYGARFPEMSVGDIVEAHCLLLKHLGIDRLACIIGGSFGGMQVLEWAIRHPKMAARCVCIASAHSLSAQALAFDSVARNVITSDPNWNNGDYYDGDFGPLKGLAQARQIGHITYLSQGMMAEKFGRERLPDAVSESAGPADSGLPSPFQVSRYLDYQGQKFTQRFDANSYLRIMHAMDNFDLAEKAGSLEGAFAGIEAKMLIVALSTDWLFPPEQSKEIANALLRAGKAVSYSMLSAPHGHDAFLVDIDHLVEMMQAFLPWVPERVEGETSDPEPGDQTVRGAGKDEERQLLLSMISPGARILDVGCGDGELLASLASERDVKGVGVDYDTNQVISVLDRGYDIFQEDVDGGLAMIPDDSYDYAILSETLQVVRRPRVVLKEMLRVAQEGIVSFPNFGRFSRALTLLRSGRMPVGGSLPFEWYDTPNIHLFTLRDFVTLCRHDGIDVLDMACISRGFVGRLLVKLGFCNLGADRVLVKVARADGAAKGRGRGCRSCTDLGGA
ncbi:MAG: homoserine O-acetyltransferase [Verrucomicrobia bacterium]|nr:homoserine O-acetyltransferase [Verrucomicrobiota bacterium]